MNIASIVSKFEENQMKIFKITMVLYCFSGLINITMYKYIDIVDVTAKICRYIAYIIFSLIAFLNIFKEYDEEINLKNILFFIRGYMKNHIVLTSLICISILIFISCRNRIPIIMIIILCGSFKYNFSDFIKIIFKTNVIFMAITMIGATLGIVPDIMISRGADTFRYSMGYIYPLEFMTHFLFIIMMYIYIKRNQFEEKQFLLINIVNMLIFKITDARAGGLLVLTITLLVLIINKINFEFAHKKLIRAVNVALVITYPIISIILGYIYNPKNSFMFGLNKAMSGRLALEKRAFETFGCSLFGENIKWVGFGGALDPGERKNIYNFVDCAYIKDLLDYGIIFFVIIIIGYMYITLMMIKKENIFGLITIHTAMVISIMEPRLLQIEMNPFLMLMSSGVMISSGLKSRDRLSI